MNIVKEQIELRKLHDQKVFNEAIKNVIAAVDGGKISFYDEKSDDAIKEIFKYFNIVEFDDTIIDPKESIFDKLESYCRPHGIMYRRVLLDDGWYKKAAGAMLGFRESDHTAIALIHRGNNYVYYDEKKKKYVYINKKNASQFSNEAICFYRPLPQKKLTIVDLIKYAIPTWSIYDFLFIVFITFSVTIIGTVMPALTYFILHNVVEQARFSLLYITAFFMFCVTIATTLIGTIRSIVTNSLGTKLDMYLGAAVMSRLISFPVGFFRNRSSGEVVSRATDVSTLCRTIIGLFFDTSLTSIFSLIYIFQISLYAKSLVIPSLIMTLIMFAMHIVFTFAKMQENKQLKEKSALNSGLTYSTISGIQKIKLAGAEKRMFARWAKQYTEEASLLYSPPFLTKYTSTIIFAITLIGEVIMYYIAVRSNVSVAVYYAFTLAYAQITAGFNGLSSAISSIAEVKPILDMTKPILETVPETSGGKRPVKNIEGRIEFNNVSFRYDEKSPIILNNLSFKVKAGEYVAIVGKTGCGKSTLVRLLLGFEKPTKGSIYVDNYDITMVDIKSVRRNFGTVLQDGKLFQGSLFYNIVITNPKLTLKDAWEAAEIADIADDIKKLPMGMHTLISEGQGGLSGGQKQRLMIARAVASKPRVIIFDEATSALDNVTQKKVSEALDKLKCTRFVIAHRLSTIKNCDRILFIDNGKIVEEGSYDDLINLKGKFFELVERQRL